MIDEEVLDDVAEDTKTPKGYESPEVRKALAEEICRQIDDYESDMSGTYAVWRKVRDVYDCNFDADGPPHSLDFGDDVTAYHIAVLQTSVDALVSNTAGGISFSNPYFAVSGTAMDDNRREAVEQTLNYALKAAGIARKCRASCLNAAMFSRGPLRISYESISKDDIDSVEDVTNPYQGGEYEGFVIDEIDPVNFIVYPSSCQSVIDAVLVGDKFIETLGDVWSKQKAGVYYDDVDILEGSDDGSSTDIHAHDAKDMFQGNIRVWDNDRRAWKRYWVVVEISGKNLLKIEEYKLARPLYFAPYIRYQPGRFWPSRSIGARLLDVQTIMNDAATLALVGTASEAFQSAIGSGGMNEQQTKIGIGTLTETKYPLNLQFTSNRFNPGGVTAVMDLARQNADEITRISRAGYGAGLKKNTTATEAAGVLQGQAEGLSEYRDNFADEMVRMVYLMCQILATNFEQFKAFHKDAILMEDGTGSDLLANWTISANGQDANTSPQTTFGKIELMMRTAKALGIQLNTTELFKAVVNTIDLPFSLAKILPEVNNGAYSQQQLIGLEKVIADANRASGNGATMEGVSGPTMQAGPGV